MINIKELTPHKIPGKTSLFVTTPYNPDVVKALKACAPFSYTKKDNIWEIPTTRLAKFVNEVSGIDDICIELKPEKKSLPVEDIKLFKHKTKPYPYQEEGIKYGLTHNKWLLLDAPGLGKTLQMIYLAEELKKREDIKHCLIVCGLNTLKTNWEKEIQKHSTLSCRILGKKITKKGTVNFGSIPERLLELKKPLKEFFLIVNIETLRNDEIIKELVKGKNSYDMIVFDECHTAKNPQSTQGKNLLKLNSKYMIGLTGTLLLNNPLDCYVPLKWIGADRSTYGNFKQQYVQYGGFYKNEFIGYKNIPVLKDQLAEVSLRRTEDLLDLPDKTFINEELDMCDRQQKFYQNIVDGIFDEIDKVQLKRTNILALIARLRQATACPSILTTEDVPSAKQDRCCELVDQITSNGNKVVIFSTFKQTVYELAEKLRGYSPLVCTGDYSDAEISSNIDIFQQDKEHKVFIATWQKCGTGITLNAASYAIFIDTPFTAGQYEQAWKRIHRIGSKKPVFIYNLIASNTFDERVKYLVDSKSVVSDYIVDNVVDERTFNVLQQFIMDLK